MAVAMESAVIMGKNYLNDCESIAKTTDLTLKQMFDMSTGLVSEQDEILIGNNWLGESFMEIPVIDWWRMSYQSTTHEGLRLLGFCCASVRFSKTPNRTMHVHKDWDD